jgi:hypothetical protein
VAEAGSLLHVELVDAFAALVSSNAGAAFERHNGYVFVSYPRAPLPSMNGVWSGDEDASASAAPPWSASSSVCVRPALRPA